MDPCLHSHHGFECTFQLTSLTIDQCKKLFITKLFVFRWSLVRKAFLSWQQINSIWCRARWCTQDSTVVRDLPCIGTNFWSFGIDALPRISILGGGTKRHHNVLTTKCGGLAWWIGGGTNVHRPSEIVLRWLAFWFYFWGRKIETLCQHESASTTFVLFTTSYLKTLFDVPSHFLDSATLHMHVQMFSSGQAFKSRVFILIFGSGSLSLFCTELRLFEEHFTVGLLLCPNQLKRSIYFFAKIVITGCTN